MNYSRMKLPSAQLMSRTRVRTKLSENAKEEDRLSGFVFLFIAIGLVAAWSFAAISLSMVVALRLTEATAHEEVVSQQENNCEHEKKEKY